MYKALATQAKDRGLDSLLPANFAMVIGELGIS